MFNISSNLEIDIQKVQIWHPWQSSPVLGSPAFDKAHTDGAHPGELVDSFEALVDRLSQQGCKFLVVEYF